MEKQLNYFAMQTQFFPDFWLDPIENAPKPKIATTDSISITKLGANRQQKVFSSVDAVAVVVVVVVVVVVAAVVVVAVVAVVAVVVVADDFGLSR